MKTQIFCKAIHNRNKIKFLYELNEMVIDPYYISQEKSGKKVIYGKASNSNEIKRFDYSRIANIKILKGRFSPIIPITHGVN